MSKCMLGVCSIALFLGSSAIQENQASDSCTHEGCVYEPLPSLPSVIVDHLNTDHLACVQKKASKVYDQGHLQHSDVPNPQGDQAEAWQQLFQKIGNVPKVEDSAVSASLAPLTWAYMPSTAEATPCGPNMWHVIEGAEACAEVGTQSPINCPIENATKHSSLTAKDLQLAHVGECQNVEYHLNEHTVEMEFAPPSCNKALKATWQGKDFFLQTMRYHSPSEHMWDGGYFPLEVHHIHKSEDGQALIIAVMVSVTKDANDADKGPARFLEDTFVNIPLPGQEDHQHNRFDSKQTASQLWNPYAHFIPSLEDKFFIYQGSFTTPPCEKNVMWVFPAKAVTIPHSALDIFRELINADPINQLAEFGKIIGAAWNATPSWNPMAGEVSWDSTLRTNIRPIQKLRGRDEPDRTFFVIETDAIQEMEALMKEQDEAMNGNQQHRDSDESSINATQEEGGATTMPPEESHNDTSSQEQMGSDGSDNGEQKGDQNDEQQEQMGADGSDNGEQKGDQNDEQQEQMGADGSDSGEQKGDQNEEQQGLDDLDLLIPATTQEPHEQKEDAKNSQKEGVQQGDDHAQEDEKNSQKEGVQQGDDQKQDQTDQEETEIKKHQESNVSDGSLTGLDANDDLGSLALDPDAAAEQLQAAEAKGSSELNSLHEGQNSTDAQEEASEVESSSFQLTWIYGETENCSPDQNACGENTWSKVPEFALCGKQGLQSPIDVKSSIAANPPASEITDLKMEVLNECSDAEFLLNEHTVEVELLGKCRHAYKLTWKQKEFYMTQFHYHAPSEHTVDGGYFPLEVHNVHKAEDGQSIILTIFGAVKDKPESEVDAHGSAFFMDVLLKIPKPGADDRTNNRFQQIRHGALVNPYKSFMPSLEESFYYYQGTFTAPPCKETTWIILPKAVMISQSALDMYRELVNADPVNQLAHFESITHMDKIPPWNSEAGSIDWDTSLKCNIRSVQPLQGDDDNTRQLFKVTK